VFGSPSFIFGELEDVLFLLISKVKNSRKISSLIFFTVRYHTSVKWQEIMSLSPYDVYIAITTPRNRPI
jgi:hypothetical protein